MMQYYYLYAFTNRKQTCHALTIGWKGKGNYSEYEKEMKRRLIDEIEKRNINIRYNKKGQPILYFSYLTRNFVSGVEILFGLAKTTKYAGRGRKVKRRKFPFAGPGGVVTLKLNKRGA